MQTLFDENENENEKIKVISEVMYNIAKLLNNKNSANARFLKQTH